MTITVHDRFHRALAEKLTSDIQHRIAQLATGSAKTIQGSAETVAEKYSAQVAHIEALSGVLDLCKEIEQDLYGHHKEGAEE